MPIKKIEAGRVITQTIDTFIGTQGTIWYDEETGEMRLHDGNPGGIPLGSGGGYVLHTATVTRLGGVRIGVGINVSPNGTISVNTNTTYTLTTATISTLGGIKVGENLSISADGTLSATASVRLSDNPPLNPTVGSLWYDTVSGRMYVWFDNNWIDASPQTTYVLPTATTSTIGGIKVGRYLSIGIDGTLSATSNVILSDIEPVDPGPNTLWYDTVSGRLYVWFDSSWIDASPQTALIPATTSTLGGIKVGRYLSIDRDGTLNATSNVIISSTAPIDPGPNTLWYDTISGRSYIWFDNNWVDANPQTALLPATTSTLGGVKIGKGIEVALDGKISTTLQLVTDSGSTTSNAINITNTTTGALQIAGGVSVGKDLFVAGDVKNANGSLVFIPTTDAAPNRQNGQLWFNSEDGRAYIKYNDNWVDLSPSIVPPVSTYLGDLTIDGTTISTIDSTLTNIYIDSNLDVIGNINAPSIYDNGNRVVTAVLPSGSTYIGVENVVSTGTQTSFTVVNLGVQTLTAGTDTVVSSSTGTITVWTTSTLQSVTNRGATTNNTIRITNNTDSTSTTTGGLIVSGGVGVGGDLYVGGKIVARELDIQYTTVTTTIVETDDIIKTSNTTNSTSTTTGALVVAGGVGIGGDVNIGGDIFINKDIRDINGSVIHIATTSTAPTRVNGQLWFNSDDGRAYIKYDGTWVDLSPTIVPPISTYLGDLTIDGTTISTIDSTLTNIYIDSILDVTGPIYTNNYLVSTLTNISSGIGIAVLRNNSGTVTVTNTGVLEIIAGVDTSISTATGVVIINNTSTLQSITNRGSTTSNAINITNTTTSALTVAGGVGINGDLYVGGDIRDINGSVIHIATTSTAPTRVNGQVWFNSEDGRAYIKYDNNWVDLSPSIVPPTSTYLGDLTIDGTTIGTVDSTLTNIYIDSNLDVTGNITAPSIYDNGNRVVTAVLPSGSTYIGIENVISTGTQTSFTIVNRGLQTLTVGTDTAINTSTGEVTIWTTSTLQSVTNRGATTTNAISIVNTTISTSSTTGALVVSGGVGIGGDVWASGVLYAKDLGSPSNRIGKIYLEGQTIDLGGTLISTALDGGILIQKSNGDLEKLATSSLTLGTTGTDSVSLSVVDGILIIKSSTVDVAGLVTTGTVTATNIIVNGLTSSTSTTTGALIVAGGVGIGGSVYAGPIYDSDNRVITSVIASGSTYIGVTDLISTGTQTSFTIVNLGVQTLTAGTDTTVSSSTGTVTVWTTSTLQSVTDRGATTNNTISITNTTASTSTTTGALVVSGGVGIGGDLYISGEIVAQKFTVEYTTVTTTYLITDDIISTYNTTSSTSTTTGALVVAGGAGIGGDLYVNGDIYRNNISIGYGYTGSKGTDGVIGYNGSVGYTGSTGTQGEVGYTGSTGTQGEVGYTGSTGTQGISGYTGSTGTQGEVGYTGSTGTQGEVGYTGSQGPGADQFLDTTSSVIFGNVTIGPGGVITFANGSIQSGRAPRMVVDQDFIDAPDYDAFFATLLPGDFYWSVAYSQIKILVDYGGYYDWQDLTVYSA